MRVEGLARGLVEGVDGSGDERYRQDVPHFHQPGYRERAEQEYERRGDELGDEYEPALVQPVGEHAAEQVERDGGGGVGETDVSEV